MSQLFKKSRWDLLFLVSLSLVITSGCIVAASPNPPNPPVPPPPVNKAPTINYIAVQQEVVASSTTEVRCVAADPEGDTLSYSWSADGGKISGEASTVNWTAPETKGKYTIRAVVSDGKGGTTTESVNISVVEKPNRVPVVISVIVKPEGKGITTITPDKPVAEVKVKLNSMAEIQCNVQDPDGDQMTFTWQASDGRIVGEGSKVQYFTSAKGEQKVTFTAIDARGARTKFTINFDIPCCGSQ